MKNIGVPLLIFALCCTWARAAPKKGSGWVVGSDFSETQLANLTPQKEHELQLKGMAERGPVLLGLAFAVELFANAIGNQFFAFASDQKANLENVAVAGATFQLFTKLQFQQTILEHITSAHKTAALLLNETAGDVGVTFAKWCATIDDDLKKQPLYAAAKEEFKKRGPSSSSARIYQYGLPKTVDDLRKAFAELANDGRSKRINAHFVFSYFIGYRDEAVVKRSILELANEPGNVEPVQKIFEKSVEEIIPLVKDISPAEVDIRVPVNINISYLKPVLSEKLLSKIRENADLRDDFEAIYKRNRDNGNI